MKKFKSYETVSSYSNGLGQLPVGGYVLVIKDVRYEENSESSDRLVIAFDITEGEHKGFFQQKFDSDLNQDKKWKGTYSLYVPNDNGTPQDEWTARRFKTFVEAVEKSNDGYTWDWDENKWKGKLVGGVFGEIHTLIDGSEATYTALRSVYSVKDVQEGKYKIPKPSYRNGASADSKTANEGFMNVESDEEEGLPF